MEVLVLDLGDLLLRGPMSRVPPRGFLKTGGVIEVIRALSSNIHA